MQASKQADRKRRQFSLTLLYYARYAKALLRRSTSHHRNNTTEPPNAKDKKSTRPIMTLVSPIRGGPTTKAAPFLLLPLSETQRWKVGEPCGTVAWVLPVLVAALVSCGMPLKVCVAMTAVAVMEAPGMEEPEISCTLLGVVELKFVCAMPIWLLLRS